MSRRPRPAAKVVPVPMETIQASPGPLMGVSVDATSENSARPSPWGATWHDDLLIVAEWLCAIGFGGVWTSPDHPLPKCLRRPLAVAVKVRDEAAFAGSSETVEDYMRMLETEGAW